MTFVIWKDGKPYSTNDSKEADRLKKRIEVIDRILKEIGYEEGYEKYDEYVKEMVETDFNKYVDFVKKVQACSDSTTKEEI